MNRNRAEVTFELRTEDFVSDRWERMKAVLLRGSYEPRIESLQTPGKTQIKFTANMEFLAGWGASRLDWECMVFDAGGHYNIELLNINSRVLEGEYIKTLEKIDG